MVTVIHGTSDKQVSSKRLAAFFEHHTKYDGFLYIGYPIIATTEGVYSIDALLVSKAKGVVAFNLIEGRELSNFKEEQDASYNKLESKFRSHTSLMTGRNLEVPINPVTFAPVRNDIENLFKPDYPVCNESNLEAWLDTIKWEKSNYFESLLSVIQSICTIRKGRKKREVQKENSRGAKLRTLENSIANFDSQQARAVIETVEGVQRIRGLAGSGKTIILAQKAAYLHEKHPDWKIAITFQTRSLKTQFKKLINNFSLELSNEEPDWDKIHILHAWGAPGGGDRNGLYYSFCQQHNLEYSDFSAAKKYGENKEFDGVCQKALDECKSPLGIYDLILIDEAQDFAPSFLRLCYEMLKPEKRLVYAYDELQNLRAQSLPSPEQIFGNNIDGSPKVRFNPNQSQTAQQDLILKMCYRNSRPVLVTAHALGFGIYRKPFINATTGLVQMFDHNDLWREVGYEVTDGELKGGHEVTLARNEESSPVFLENHSPIDDLIQFHCFESPEAQAHWVTKAIKDNLQTDELRPDDIVVVNPDPFTTREAAGFIRKILLEEGINSHIAGFDTSPDIFFDSNSESVVFTGINRVKGNEAGMVYIINAQDCDFLFLNRNRLFTAITRSKAWVRVLGIGKNMQSLMNEFEQVKKNNFTLKFRYPTEEEKRHLNIINRDMTENERSRIGQNKDNIVRIIDDLEKGRLYPEDIGLEQLNKLKTLLNREVD